MPYLTTHGDDIKNVLACLLIAQDVSWIGVIDQGGPVAYCKLVAFACVFVVSPLLYFSFARNTLRVNTLSLPVIQPCKNIKKNTRQP